MLMETDMESHGSVSIMKRRSQHKTTGQSLWREPLSARSELHSHPLAEQDQACGRLKKAEGPEGPMAPIVTTGAYSVEKIPSHTSSLDLGPCQSALYRSTEKNLEWCVSSLMLIFSVAKKKKLKSCESSLRRDHANPSNQ